MRELRRVAKAKVRRGRRLARAVACGLSRDDTGVIAAAHRAARYRRASDASERASEGTDAGKKFESGR